MHDTADALRSELAAERQVVALPQIREQRVPRYLFHVYNDAVTIDGEGILLPDLESARSFAVNAARGMMAEGIRTKGQLNLYDWVEIADENGDITVVMFRDAVTLGGPRDSSTAPRR